MQRSTCSASHASYQDMDMMDTCTMCLAVLSKKLRT